MGHPIHKHMHTHITKSNVHAAIKDDKDHMKYLEEDIKDDARGKGDGNKEWETADEKHITHLAEDVKDDERKEHISRRSSSPLNVHNVIVDDALDSKKGGYVSKTDDHEAVNEMKK